MNHAAAQERALQHLAGQQVPRIRGVPVASSLQSSAGEQFQDLISLRDGQINDLSQQLLLSQQEVRKGDQRERELQAWKDQTILEVQGLKQQLQKREEQIKFMGSTIESLRQQLAEPPLSSEVASLSESQRQNQRGRVSFVGARCVAGLAADISVDAPIVAPASPSGTVPFAAAMPAVPSAWAAQTASGAPVPSGEVAGARAGLVEPQQPKDASPLRQFQRPPSSPRHVTGSGSNAGSEGNTPDPVLEQDVPEDALRSRQDAVFLMQEQFRRQIAMHRSSYTDCGDKVLASCSSTHGALPIGRAESPRPGPLSSRQDLPLSVEGVQAMPDQPVSVQQASVPPTMPRTSSVGRRERSSSRGAPMDRSCAALDERPLRPMPGGRAASPRPEHALSPQDPQSPEAAPRQISALPPPTHQEQSPSIGPSDERPLRPMPSGGMLVSLSPSEAPTPSTPRLSCRERSSSRKAPMERSGASNDERPLRPMRTGGSLVSLETSFFDESPEELAQKKVKQQKVARQIQQRRQRQTPAITASPAGGRAAKGVKPSEELVPAESTRKSDSMLSHTKSVPTGLLAGRAPAARAAQGSPAQTKGANSHVVSRHQEPPQAPSLVPEGLTAEPISARESASPCDRKSVDLHQRFANLRDEMKRQRGPIAVGNSVPTRTVSASVAAPSASGAVADFAQQRSSGHLHAIRAA